MMMGGRVGGRKGETDNVSSLASLQEGNGDQGGPIACLIFTSRRSVMHHPPPTLHAFNQQKCPARAHRGDQGQRLRVQALGGPEVLRLDRLVPLLFFRACIRLCVRERPAKGQPKARVGERPALPSSANVSVWISHPPYIHTRTFRLQLLRPRLVLIRGLGRRRLADGRRGLCGVHA